VSHEWIYDFIRLDKRQGGRLFKQLRRGHKRYRKGSRGKREIIPNRIGIELRPKDVDSGEHFGHWEVDTVLGKQNTGAIVSLVERKSKLYLIKKVKEKSAEDVRKAMISMSWCYRGSVKTITADNGTEFCEHERVAKKLRADIYFASHYSPWERGLNENFNGLLRQYIKKGTDLRTITDKDIQRIERSLNLGPRKCLGYKQPAEVFKELRKAA
jgi:IS30 family transposase